MFELPLTEVTVDAAAFEALELPKAEDWVTVLVTIPRLVGERDVDDGASTIEVVEDSAILVLCTPMLKLVLNNAVFDAAALEMIELPMAWDWIVVLAAPIFELLTGREPELAAARTEALSDPMVKLPLEDNILEAAAIKMVELPMASDCVVVLAAPVFELGTG